MRVYLQDMNDKVSIPASLEGIKLEDCKLLWVDVQEPPEQEFDEVTGFFGIHPLAAKESLGPHRSPKIQEYPNHLFIMWNFLRDRHASEEIRTTTVSMFLGMNYLVTVRHTDMPELDDILERLKADPSIYRGQPSPLLYAIMDDAVDAYFPLVEDLTSKIDAYQDELMNEKSVGDIKTIMTQKHRNMSVRRVVAAHRDVVLELTRRDVPFIPEELAVYILDVYDHLVRIYSQVDSNSDLITSSLDIHLNMVSNRLNVTMKRLTTIATIFLPLTFLVGLYGMNFHMPEYSFRYAYLLFWVAVVVIAVVMVIIAKIKDWF
jgi:magnesium transporter